MRRRTILLFAALLAFSIILPLLFLFPQGKSTPALKPDAQANPSISLQECGIANSEAGHAGFCTLYMDSPPGSTNISLFLFPEKPKGSVYFLDYPHIEAKDYAALKSYLAARFSGSGIPFQGAGIERVNSVSDSIIIIPTGVFPRPIYDGLQNISEKGNVLIYMGLAPGYLLETDGSITSNPNADVMLSGSSRWNAVPAGRPLIYYSPLSLDKFKSANDAGEELFLIAVSQAWLPQAGSAHFSLTQSKGKKTVFFPSRLPEGYPRLFAGLSGRALIRDLGKIEKPPGNILHARSSAYSRGLEVQAALNKSFSSSVFLSLSLAILRDGAEISREWIGNASMREVWFRTFPLSSELPPGDYLLSIRDQYASEYARSFLHIKNITAAKLPGEEGANSFLLLEDGRPIADSFVPVSLENKTSLGRHPSVGGVVRLPEGSAGTFYFEVEGVRVSAQSAPSQSIFSFYAAYGIPAIALILAAYLFFKSGSGRLSVVFPDIRPPHFSQVKLKKGRIMQAIISAQSAFPSKSIGLSLQDARRALQKEARKNGKDAIFSEENVLEVLNSLVSEGMLGNHSDYYCLPGENPKNAAILRMAYDSLVSSGKKFRMGKSGEILCGKDTIRAFAGGAFFPLPRAGRLILVFGDGQEISDFEGSLLSPEENHTKIRLALGTRKLALCTPQELPDVI